MADFELEGYTILDLVGSGGFSEVYKAKDNIFNRTVAIKRISKNTQSHEETLKEISIMQQIDYPLIARLLDFREEGNYSYIIMEYVEGMVLLEMVNSTSLDERQVCNIFGQIFLVIKYLQGNKILHRDLKLENIIINPRHDIKVIDFGFSKRYETDEDIFETLCGSPEYCPPEMFLGQPYSTSCDIWSLGVILYSLILKRLPFCGDNMQQTAQLIVNAVPFIPQYLSSGIIDLMKRMLVKNPKWRIRIDQIEQHQWLEEFMESNTKKSIDNLACYKLVDKENLDMNLIESFKQYGVSALQLFEDLNNDIINYWTGQYKLNRITKFFNCMQMCSISESMSAGDYSTIDISRIRGISNHPSDLPCFLPPSNKTILPNCFGVVIPHHKPIKRLINKDTMSHDPPKIPVPYKTRHSTDKQQCIIKPNVRRLSVY